MSKNRGRFRVAVSRTFADHCPQPGIRAGTLGRGRLPEISLFYESVPGATPEEKRPLLRELGVAAIEAGLPTLEAQGEHLSADFEAGDLRLSALVIMVNDLNCGHMPLAAALDLTRRALRAAGRFHAAGVVLADCFGADNHEVFSEERRRSLLRELLDDVLPLAEQVQTCILLEPMLQSARSTFPSVESAPILE